MTKSKWIVLTAVTVATLTNGCMAFKEIFGDSRESYNSSDGSGAAITERAPTRFEESASPIDESANRSGAAADRAEATAARASMEAEKTETRFRKSLHK